MFNNFKSKGYEGNKPLVLSLSLLLLLVPLGVNARNTNCSSVVKKAAIYKEVVQEVCNDSAMETDDDRACCPPRTRNFFFDVMGDTAYQTTDTPKLINLINNVINREHPAFVVHVGDQQNDPAGTAAGTSETIALTEAQFIPKRDLLWTIRSPYIITPGDNDWSDTIKTPAGPVPGTPPFPPNPDPIGTLNAFRNVYYNQGTNVPFPFAVVVQAQEQPQFSEFVENRRWIYNNIVFVTIHTISGANGLVPPASPFPAAQQAIINETSGLAGFQGRINANLAWLTRAFDVADQMNARGVVIFTQAPSVQITNGFYNFRTPPAGYDTMLGLIRTRTLAALPLGRQVLLAYGDGHFYMVSKPLPLAGTYPPTDTTVANLDLLPNFTAVEVPGASASFVTGAQGRVKVKVDFNDPGLFSFYSSVDTL